MKRTTVLRMKLGLSGLHAFVLVGPLALLCIAFEKIAAGSQWLSDGLEIISGNCGGWLLPEWWPTRRILNELRAEQQRERKRKADELHK